MKLDKILNIIGVIVEVISLLIGLRGIQQLNPSVYNIENVISCLKET